MAVITNIGTYTTTIKDRNGRTYDIGAGNNVTIANEILPYDEIDEGIAKGWISVTGYTDPSAPAGAATLGQQTSANSTSVVLASDAVGKVSGITVVSAVTLTRPADTTAYAALDNISNSTTAPSVLTFANAARVSGGSGYVNKVRLETTQSANVAKFRLHLYHTAPTAINDNAACTLLWANRDKRIGTVDLPACVTEGTGSDAARSHNYDICIGFALPTGTSIYGLLETLDAFTPTSGQQFYIELIVEQN